METTMTKKKQSVKKREKRIISIPHCTDAKLGLKEGDKETQLQNVKEIMKVVADLAKEKPEFGESNLTISWRCKLDDGKWASSYMSTPIDLVSGDEILLHIPGIKKLMVK